MILNEAHERLQTTTTAYGPHINTTQRGLTQHQPDGFDVRVTSSKQLYNHTLQKHVQASAIQGEADSRHRQRHNCTALRRSSSKNNIVACKQVS